MATPSGSFVPRVAGISAAMADSIHRDVKTPEQALEVFAVYECVCGAKDWTLHRHDANNGLRLQCAACNRIPFPSRFLPQGKKGKRRESGQPTLSEVIAERGAHCYGCGLPQDRLLLFRIHLQVHHARSYEEAQHEGPFIPLCGVCHHAITFAQATLKRFIKELEEGAA